MSTRQSGSAPYFFIRLFGSLHVERRDNATRRIDIPPGRPQSLLAYLLLHRGRPVPRDQVTAALWPGVEWARARRYLSDSLYRLRKALDGDWVRVEGDTLAISPALDLTVDVWNFEEAIHRRDPASLAQAMDLYRGHLLAGLTDDWLLAPRLAFHESYLDAVETLARQAEEARDLARAALYHRQLIQAEPYRETGYVGLMRVLAARRRPEDALQIYEQLARVLAQELDAAPSAYARELADQLRAEVALAAAPGELVHPLWRLPFVGRQAERALALRRLQDLEQGRGGVLLVEGEPGMGKSRLLEHLLESAAWRSLATIHVCFPEDAAANPYGPIAQALAPLWNSNRGPQLAAALTQGELASLGPLAPDWYADSSTHRSASADAHMLLNHAWVELVRAVSDLAPCLLVLDDVHWATPSTWDLLQALVPCLDEMPCLLVLAYRRMEMERKPGWAMLSAWELERPLHTLVLGPLQPEDVARLLPPQTTLDLQTFHAVTGGNPFYIQQALVSEPVAAQSLEQILTHRLHALPAAPRQALEAAAVLGTDIPFALWRDLLHASHAHLTAVADALTARGWLRVQGRHYRFGHHLLREAVIAHMPAERRRRYHSRAADLLMVEAAEDIFALARHLDRAGRAPEAAQAYQAVAEKARSLHAYAEARDAYCRGLDLLAPGADAQRRELLRGLAQVLPITGEWEEQETILAELEQLAQTTADDSLQREVLLHRGQSAFQAGRYADALALLDQAAAMLPETGAEEMFLQIEMLRGDIYLRINAYEDARRYLEEALGLARNLALGAEEGRALDGLAWAGTQQGQDADQVLALYRQALDAQKNAGDRLGEARTLLNILTAQVNAGKWDQVLALADDVLAAQASVHYRLGEAVVHQTMAITYAALGAYEQAMDHAEQALAGFQAVNEQAGAVIARELRGMVAARQNNPEQAEADLREALAQAEALDIPIFVFFAQQDLGQLLYELDRCEEAAPLLVQARAGWKDIEDALNAARCTALLGLVQLSQGHLDQARRLAEDGWRTFREDAPGGEDRQGWLLWLTRLWLRLGEEEIARQLIQEAYAELQQQAGRIHDGALRASFFQRAVYNRAIVDLYDRLHEIQRTRTVILRQAATSEPLPVQWTLYAPEDEAISDTGEQRRFVLARLLREAQAHGAQPTDAELAQALGVSRRTVIRDRKLLEIRD